ncbi:MAG: glycoside hydrolase family 43 protein [Clostridia bacterium]|nr:glycoside hydrolase family 43 protein [Clostridia bacterium]
MVIIKNSGNTDARDPALIYDDGYFYHTYSLDGRLFVTKAKSVRDLVKTEGVVVWTAPKGTEYSEQIWAPELHKIDGKCYIYVACSNGDNYTHRTYVLYNDSPNPQAPFKLKGKLADDTDKWSIDATVFKHNGELYTVWSGWEGDIDVCQNLYIAKMSDPFTISSKRYLLSTPTYEWEKRGATGLKDSPFVNEGPYPLIKNGTVHIVYSASGSWCNHYCLGIITLKGNDPLDMSAWVKHPEPVFKSNDKVNGPGHATFTLDTHEGDLIFYHAFDTDDKGGWNTCHASAQNFTFDGDFPVFGEPTNDED